LKTSNAAQFIITACEPSFEPAVINVKRVIYPATTLHQAFFMYDQRCFERARNHPLIILPSHRGNRLLGQCLSARRRSKRRSAFDDERRRVIASDAFRLTVFLFESVGFDPASSGPSQNCRFGI
jgi:hypothetical protein